jgi:hypothetical protein
MSEEKQPKVDFWSLITLLLVIICLAASFWATNTATQTRFDVMQMEIRNLNNATHKEVRAVERDVLVNREMIRNIKCTCPGPASGGGE